MKIEDNYNQGGNSWDDLVSSVVYSLWWSMIIWFVGIDNENYDCRFRQWRLKTITIKVEIVGVDCKPNFFNKEGG